MTVADRITQRSPTVRRSLAVMLLLLAAILAWRDVILPIRGVLTSQYRWRTHVRSTLAIARGRAVEIPTLQSRLNALPDAPIWQRFYPDGASANGGTAFREDIRHYASAAGMAIESVAPLPAARQLGLTRVGMRILAVADIRQFTSFLTQLRRSPHYLRVDALRVVAPQVQMKNANERLLVQLQIFGYARPLSGAGE